jgi:hypothetical protein
VREDDRLWELRPVLVVLVGCAEATVVEAARDSMRRQIFVKQELYGCGCAVFKG